MTITFDTNILLNYYQGRAGVPLTTAGAANPAAAAKKYAPSAPWLPGAQTASNTPALMSTAVKNAMLGHKLVDESAAKLDLAGASADYKKLFALYQGIDTLAGVVDQISAKNVNSADKARIQSVFTKGLAEITAYTDQLNLDQLRLTRASVADKAKSTVGVSRAKTDYTTPPLVSGDVSAPVDAFQGDVKFNISIKRVNTIHDVSIDLSEMGATPRNMANVVSYINGKLGAAEVGTSVSSLRIPGGDRMIQIAGKATKVGVNPDKWAMKFNIDSGDTLTFSAPKTEPAIYLAQSVGNPDPDGKSTTKDGVITSQLLKVQTDTTDVTPPPQATGAANFIDGRVWSKDMEKSVGAVHATQVAPDGSVYVLADVTDRTAGQAIKGDQDVALLKYDSAGKLLFTRTLGAANNASGLALAVSADGKIAIAGKVTGGLSGAAEGALNSGATGSFATQSDSFVTLMDADGQEQWTERRGARQNDEATSIAFGADGSVYVAGRAQSSLPGTTGLGGWDSYIEGFKADAKNKVSTLFVQNVGSSGSDRPGGLVVDGNSLVLANNEAGRAVLHRFDLSGATATETATRDLGDLAGGSIAGLALDGGQLVIAGSAGGDSLTAGVTTRAYNAGLDAFAARISSSLTPDAGDRLAYYGGAGDDKVAGLAISEGRVYLTGQAGSDLPDLDAVGKKDGFLTELNLDTGATGFTRRFSGTGGYATPTAIAVDTSGASALDRLGLPKGTMDMTDSVQLGAISAVRAGDQFQVRGAATGPFKTITIDAGETLETLVTKLKRGLNYQADVRVVTSDGQRKLQIKPLNPRTILEFAYGKSGKDALSLLGIPEGVVRATTTSKDGKTTSADGKGNFYGLGMDRDMNLSSTGDIAHTKAELASALNVIRTAYKDLKEAATPESERKAAKAKATGTVPAYLTNQIANYQAALDRLNGAS
ncbi:regulatory protein FlaEY [soil metagenome]